MRDGVPLPDSVWNQIEALAEELGVSATSAPRT
jgi:hypothetical protein